MGSLQPCSPLGPRPCWVNNPVQPVGRGSAAAGLLLPQHVLPGVCVLCLWLPAPSSSQPSGFREQPAPRLCELPLPFVSVWSGLRWDCFQKLEQLGDCGKVFLREADCTGRIVIAVISH